MANSGKKELPAFYGIRLGAFLTFASLFVPIVTAACGHLYYYSDFSKTCEGKSVGYKEVWEAYTYEVCSKTSCHCVNAERRIRTCEAWQIAVTAHTSGKSGDWGVCQCKKECLESPYKTSGNPAYYDDPVNKTKQDPENIKLPVVLAWQDVPGWKNVVKFSIGNAPSVNYGPQSYVIEIQDTDSENGIDRLILTDRQKEDSSVTTTIGSKKAYYKVITEDGTRDWAYFNSREAKAEGVGIWPCFFNSSHNYRWRVRPCCDAFGEECKEYNPEEGWWYFKTSTAPEIIAPLDPDWNGTGDTADESFKNLKEGNNPLQWCHAMLPEEEQTKGQPAKYAGSYELYVTSDESNSITQTITESIVSAAQDFWNWLSGKSSDEEAAAEQQTHSLSIINGKFIYDIFPNTASGDVDNWFPAQSRGDLAYFTRDRVYSWGLRSCYDDDTFHCYETGNKLDSGGQPEYSQEWKITTPYEKIDAPAAMTPTDISALCKGKTGDDYHACACENPVGLPISIGWSRPAGANSFVYETDIGNFGDKRKTIWNTIPNSGKEFDAATLKLLGMENVALKLDTIYHWHVKPCPQFDSGAQYNDCDAWSNNSDNVSNGYAFCTTGRPPKTDSMTPGGLTTDITFPQNFTWEKVPGANSYNIELYDGSGNLVASRTTKFDVNESGRPSIEFDYPYITQPAEGTANISYTWKVQTCADNEGERCGPNWASQYFVINRAPKPNLETEKTEFDSLKDTRLTWSGSTKYALVTITYSGSSDQEGCDTGTVITSFRSSDGACSMGNGCIDPSIKASCAGTYQYKIQPCVDPNCSDKGEGNALNGTFTVGSLKDSSSLGNFTVCGQRSDNLDTEWDETNECTISSLFFLFKLIINFLLFKLAFLLLPVLALISGGMFYLGMNGKDTIPTIKRMWKYAGIGYAIMFMAWFIVSWLVALTGYEGVKWWQVF